MSSLRDQISQLASYDSSILTKPNKRDSYLFEPSQAAEHDINSIHLLGISGLDQLKDIDESFGHFEDKLFSENVKNLDRTSLNQSQVNDLNTLLNRFLIKLSPYLMTRYSAKVLEWLIRKFRVNEFNIEATFLAFLPYHDSTAFAKIVQLLKISEKTSSNKFSFLLSIKKSKQSLQRAVLVRSMKSDHELLKLVSESLPSALEVINEHRPMASFWSATLIDYIKQQSKKINEGELATLFSCIRATLKVKTSRDVQYAGRMVLLVLSQSITLGDKVVTSLITSMFRSLEGKGNLTDAESDHILLTMLAVIENQGIQVASDDVIKRLPVIPDVGKRILGYLDNYSVDRSVQSFTPNLLKLYVQNDAIKSILHFLLESPKLSKVVAQSICDNLVKYATNDDYQNLVALTYQRWGETFDTSFQKEQRNLNDSDRKKLFESLANANTAGLHSTLNSEDGVSTLFLSVNAADNSTRNLALSNIFEQIESGKLPVDEESSKDFITETLIARLQDDSPTINSTLYSKPDIILNNVKPDLIIDAISSAVKIYNLDLSILMGHVEFLMSKFIKRYPDYISKVESIVWNHLLITSKTLEVSKNIWNIISKAKVNVGAFKGVAKDVINQIEKKEYSKANLSIAKQIANNFVSAENDSFLIKSINPISQVNSRLLALLVSHFLLSTLSRKDENRKVLIAASIFENTESNTLENMNIKDFNSFVLEHVAEAIFNKPTSDTTIHSAVGTTILKATDNLSISENINWLDEDSTEFQIERKFALSVYKLANAPYALTQLATTLLRSVFKALRDNSLAFLASIWVNNDMEDYMRNAALRHAEAFFKVSATDNSKFDYQTIVPSLLIALQDVSKDVRIAAVNCLKILSNSTVSGSPQIFAFDSIYGKNSKQIQYLSTNDMKDYLNLLSEESEGFIKDGDYLSTFNGNVLSKRSTKSDKKSHKKFRTSIISYLFSHVIAWRNISCRRRLLNSLRGTYDQARLITLLPIIRSLVKDNKKDDEVKVFNNANEFEKQSVLDSLFKSFTKNTMKHVIDSHSEVYDIMKLALNNSSYGSYMIKRLQENVYEILPIDYKYDMAIHLMKIIENDNGVVSSVISDSIKSLPLDEDTYVMLLKNTRDSYTTDEVETPRKRVKSDNQQKSSSPSELITRLTSIFEWVGSLPSDISPEATSPALAITFETLALVTEIHATSPVNGVSEVDSSEVDYVEQMCLSQLRTWSDSIQDWTHLSNTIRIDTVVSCIRVSKNPQTFQQALLLIATLAKLAPDNVLHNVMPIFTFMGANVLQRDDGYSFNVVQRTIEGVVPVVVESLSKQASDENSLTQLSKSFLMTFTDASNHIPKHRRQLLFSFLINVLESMRFLGPVLMLLIDKVANKVVKQTHERSVPIALPLGIISQFNAQEQLCSIENILREVMALNSRINDKEVGQVFLERSVDNKDKKTVYKRQALALLFFVEQAMQVRKLAVQVIKSIANDEIIETKLLAIIHMLLILSAESKNSEVNEIVQVSKLTLMNVLNVIPVNSFAKIVTELLASDEFNVKVGSLHVLNIRLKSVKATHRAQVSPAVISGAELALNLLGDKNVNISDKELALHTLKTIADSAVNSELSILSKSVNSVLQYIEDSADPSPAFNLLESLSPKLQTRLIATMKPIVSVSKSSIETSSNKDVQNSAFKCLKSIVNHLPTFISPQLSEILDIALKNDILENEHHQLTSSVQALLNTISKRVPSKEIFEVLQGVYSNVANSRQVSTITAYLEVFRRSLHASNRTYIMDNHKKLFKLFLEIFDLRSLNSKMNVEDITAIEDTSIEAFSEMVVKINESTFRPVFKKLYDWAMIDLAESFDKINAYDSRRITFFRVYDSLLNKLKAIIAPYTAIAYDHTLELLDTFHEQKSSNGLLWQSLIKMITNSLKQDRGTFWTEERVMKLSDKLINQISNQPKFEKQSGVDKQIVAVGIVQLANNSRTDSSMRKINGNVLLQMRNESASVRQAALDTCQALWSDIPDKMISFIPETVSSFLTECLEDSDEIVVAKSKSLLKFIETETGESLEAYLT